MLRSRPILCIFEVQRTVHTFQNSLIQNTSDFLRNMGKWLEEAMKLHGAGLTDDKIMFTLIYHRCDNTTKYSAVSSSTVLSQLYKYTKKGLWMRVC